MLAIFFLHSILDEAEKNLTFNTDDINIYSATHQFELARALNVLHVKASTFHSYYTTGKFDKVSCSLPRFYLSSITITYIYYLLKGKGTPRQSFERTHGYVLDNPISNEERRNHNWFTNSQRCGHSDHP